MTGLLSISDEGVNAPQKQLSHATHVILALLSAGYCLICTYLTSAVFYMIYIYTLTSRKCGLGLYGYPTITAGATSG